MHGMSLFPKVLWPFNYLTLTQKLRISPQSSLNAMYYFIISAWQWLMSFTYTPCIPMKIKPNKSLSKQGTGLALSFTEREAMPFFFLHRISVVHVNLSRLIHNATDAVGQCPHHTTQACAWLEIKPLTLCLTGWHSIHWATPGTLII